MNNDFHADVATTCPNCATNLPARRDLPEFTAQVLAERARLAMLDPQGEYDYSLRWQLAESNSSEPMSEVTGGRLAARVIPPSARAGAL